MMKKTLKKISEKNYLLATLIVLVSIFAIIYITRWYLVYREDNLNKAIISDYLNELSYEEFSDYLIENGNIVIYLGIANDTDCRKYESKFKNIIDTYNLKESITYLNVTTFSQNNEDYILEFNNKYSDDKMINQVPSIIIFENGKIGKILDKNLTKASTIAFLKKYDVIIN